MNSRISVAIDKELLDRAERYASREGLSRDSLIETVLDQFLKQGAGDIVVTKGYFDGRIKRGEGFVC